MYCNNYKKIMTYFIGPTPKNPFLEPLDPERLGRGLVLREVPDQRLRSVLPGRVRPYFDLLRAIALDQSHASLLQFDQLARRPLRSDA